MKAYIYAHPEDENICIYTPEGGAHMHTYTLRRSIHTYSYI